MGNHLMKNLSNKKTDRIEASPALKPWSGRELLPFENLFFNLLRQTRLPYESFSVVRPSTGHAAAISVHPKKTVFTVWPLLPVALLIGFLGLFPVLSSFAIEPDAIVVRCFDYMRGKASVSEVDMTIHRPKWERTMTIKAWTRGDKESFFVITAPAKDKGNGTLKKDRDMWIFNPKINRVIKLPPSMMSQSWQGSDFSNNDLSKTDSLKNDYIHTIEGEEELDGMKIFHIKSIPKPDAPVVWGMQRLKIREDGIMLEEIFYDESSEPVKKMTLSKIKDIDGKPYPTYWRMEKSDEADTYTLLVYRHLEFKESLPDRFFTLSNLRNPER
jgi:outer membrane lipoprotein-sorting protein